MLDDQLVSIISELVQVSGFITLLLLTGRENPPLSNGGLMWFIVSLSYDVLVLHCIRPHYVMEVYNSVNVMVGWIVLYEKFKPLIRNVVLFLGSMLR